MKVNSQSKVFKMGTLFAGNVVSLLIGMFTAPIITRLVDPNEYGQLSFFTMYTNIFVMFITLGLERSYIRYYYDAAELQRPRLLFDCSKIPFLCLLISIPFVFAAGLCIDMGFESNMLTVIPIFLVNALILSTERFSLGSLRIQQKVLPFVVSSIFSKLCYGLIAVLLVSLIRKHEFVLLIISTTVASGVSLIYSVICNKKSWNFANASKEKSPFPRKELLKFGIPLMIQGMIVIVFQAMDKIMVKHFSTFSEVGIYASAGYYVTLCNVFASSISTITGPEMYKYNSEHPNERRLYEDINKMMSLVMFFISFSVIIAKDLLILLLGEKYAGAGMIMPFLLVGPVMIAVSGVNSISIEIKKKASSYLIVTIASAVVNFIGNYTLIPILGSKGAAISTGLSYVVYFVVTTIISKKMFNFNMSLSKCGVMIALLIGFALYNTFIRFGILTVLLYLGSIAVLFILYRESVSFSYAKFKHLFIKK